MTKREIGKLVGITKKLAKMRNKAEQWNRENSHRCGHSNTDDSLGDEGWRQLFINDGRCEGLDFSIDLINEFLMEEKQNEKTRKNRGLFNQKSRARICQNLQGSLRDGKTRGKKT
jgi:hypothetical protein